MPSDKKEDFDCSFNVILWEGNKLRAQFLQGEGGETRISFSISHRMIYLYDIQEKNTACIARVR